MRSLGDHRQEVLGVFDVLQGRAVAVVLGELADDVGTADVLEGPAARDLVHQNRRRVALDAEDLEAGDLLDDDLPGRRHIARVAPGYLQ